MYLNSFLFWVYFTLASGLKENKWIRNLIQKYHYNWPTLYVCLACSAPVSTSSADIITCLQTQCVPVYVYTPVRALFTMLQLPSWHIIREHARYWQYEKCPATAASCLCGITTFLNLQVVQMRRRARNQPRCDIYSKQIKPHPRSITVLSRYANKRWDHEKSRSFRIAQSPNKSYQIIPNKWNQMKQLTFQLHIPPSLVRLEVPFQKAPILPHKRY